MYRIYNLRLTSSKTGCMCRQVLKPPEDGRGSRPKHIGALELYILQLEINLCT